MSEKQLVERVPETIEELQAWYVARNLPPESVTRFFIGKNITERRAFGIYREGDQFVVYKNKDDGSRAVRYRGPDERYAVNELYQRLVQEIGSQKATNRVLTAAEKRRARRTTAIITAIIIIAIAYMVWHFWNKPDTGYYYCDNAWYYYDSDDWYYYDSYGGWEPYYDYNQVDNWNDYYYGSSYSGGYGYTNFADSQYYHEYESSSSSYDWDSSDSWDSGSTDFSSDW